MPNEPTNRLQQESDKVRYPVNFPGGLTTDPAVLASNMPFGPRPQNHLTQLRYKRKRGETLTQEETATLSAAEAKYRDRKTTIHVSPARKKVWKELAKAQRSLSAWIVMMVEKGIHGFEDAIKDLRDENQRLRDENTALRGTCGQLSVENSDLKTRLEGLEASLMEAMDQALRLAADRKEAEK